MDTIRDVEQKLVEWREAGLVTADQVAQILQRERSRVAPRPRSSAFAEILGYVGGSLALIAALILGAQYWDEWSTGARLGILVVTTLVVAVAAILVGRSENPAILRLSDFLFVLATIGLAFTVGLFSADSMEWSEQTTVTLATLAAFAASAVLWWQRRGTIRHVALFASTVAVLLSLGTHLEQVDPEHIGLAVWGIGLAWGMLTWAGLLPPRMVGYGLASATLIVGSLVFGGGERASVGLLLGLFTAGGLVALGVFLSSALVLAIGTLGIFIFVPRAVFEFFGDTGGGALALLVTGLLLLVAAVLIGRIGRRVIREAREDQATAEVAATPTTSRTVVAVAVSAAVLAAIAAYVVVEYVPPPEYATASAGAVPGEIAFTRWDRGNCIIVIPAAGGPEREVTCDHEGGQLTWTADGSLAMVVWDKDHEEIAVIDPDTGVTLFTREASAYRSLLATARDARSRRADGAHLESNNGDGIATVTIRQTGQDPIEVIRVDGPSSYGFFDLQWSPDGEWVMAVDTMNRLVVVSADGAMGPYLVGDDISEPAWHIAGESSYTIEITPAG